MINVLKANKTMCTLSFYIFVQGAEDHLNGVSLPDLAQVVSVPAETLSIAFTWKSVFGLMGSIVFGWLLNRKDGILIIIITTVLHAIPCSLVGYIPELYAMCTIMGLTQFFLEGIRTG